MRCLAQLLALLGLVLAATAEPRFPPPQFESGYKMPLTAAPAAPVPWRQYVDAGVLLATLAASLWLIYRVRSRRGLFWLSLFSLAYFGFYRQGCICPIGSPQNIAYGLFNSGYSVPITVLLFGLLPIVVALFAGRAFCAGVCPQGALQDLVLVKPVTVPAWLEHALGVAPFLFLGAGVTFAATGTDFVICRYDPFVSFFRLSGQTFILTAGALFLLVGMFVGRPYCRFLCPYGALLRMASLVSKWHVRATPDDCSNCRLCEQSCPYGAIRAPLPVEIRSRWINRERTRLVGAVVLALLLVATGAWTGKRWSSTAAQIDPAVAAAELFARQQAHPTSYPPMTPNALALQRAMENPAEVTAKAENVRHRFGLACQILGAWIGLVFGVKFITLSVPRPGADYEPDRGACVACARCFTACPQERRRLRALSSKESVVPS